MFISIDADWPTDRINVIRAFRLHILTIHRLIQCSNTVDSHRPLPKVTKYKVGAIAAGNAVVVKPSELAPASAQALEDVFSKYLDPDFFKIVQGGIPETTAVSSLIW